jgi:hypothetical protein
MQRTELVALVPIPCANRHGVQIEGPARCGGATSGDRQVATMKAGNAPPSSKAFRVFAMNSSVDDIDEFFREQVDQLRAKGYSPEAAVEVAVQALKACSEALPGHVWKRTDMPPLQGPAGRGQAIWSWRTGPPFGAAGACSRALWAFWCGAPAFVPLAVLNQWPENTAASRARSVADKPRRTAARAAKGSAAMDSGSLVQIEVQTPGRPAIACGNTRVCDATALEWGTGALMGLR